MVMHVVYELYHIYILRIRMNDMDSLSTVLAVWYPGGWCMCSSLKPFFPGPATCRHPAHPVSVPIFHPINRGIQALCGHELRTLYKALRSAGGFRRPLRSLTKKTENWTKCEAESHREVHGSRCKLATCKCPQLHGPKTAMTPHVRSK